jgi:O-antigen ligase
VPLILVGLTAVALFLLRPFLFRDADEIPLPPGGLLLAAAGLLAAGLLPVASVRSEARIEVLRLWSYIAALWAWAALAGHGRRWRWLLSALLLSTSVMALYALIQQAHGSNLVLFVPRPDQYGMRASGAYLCPNHFANLLDMAIPMALAVAVCRQAGLPARLFAGYTLAVASAALLLTQSRSGWFGVSAGLLATCSLLGLRRGLRRSVLALLGTVALLLGLGVCIWFASPAWQDRMREAMSGSNIRLALWDDTMGIVRSRPWLGYGGGSFRWVYPHFQSRLREFIDPEHAHNDYLELVATQGAPALLVAVAVAGLAFAGFLKAVRRDERGVGSCLAAGAAGSLAAALAHAAFDFNLNVFANVHVLAMLLGVAWAAGDRSVRGALPEGIVRPVCAVALAGAVFLGAVAVRSLHTGSLLRRAGVQARSMNYEEGARLYRLAMKSDRVDWRPRLGLARLLRVQAFWNHDAETRPGQIAESRRLYEESLRLNPWELEAGDGLATLLAMEGRDEEALAAFEEISRRLPRNQSHLVHLGLQLRHMGRHAEALRVFESARQMGGDMTIDLNIELLRRKVAAGQSQDSKSAAPSG